MCTFPTFSKISRDYRPHPLKRDFLGALLAFLWTIAHTLIIKTVLYLGKKKHIIDLFNLTIRHVCYVLYTEKGRGVPEKGLSNG